MREVDVTVVVPCYNAGQFLDQCLASIRTSHKASLEILVINDGSTDGSLDIMRRHEAADDRIRVIDKPNQGYGATVNRGITEAEGDYIAIVEPDDYVKECMYDALVDLAYQYECPDIVKSSYWRVWMPETPKEHLYHCAYYQRVNPPRQPFTLAECPVLIQYHPSIWTALYKKTFLDEYGIRFKEVPGAGWVDNPFLIETFCQARSIVYTDEPYYCYREDLPNSSSVNRANTLPYERWQDMADIVERLGVTDEGILRAFYLIGFRYSGGVLAGVDADDAELNALAVDALKRMDSKIALSMDNVRPALREEYARLMDLPTSKLPRAPYYKTLFREFMYSWKTNGMGFAFARFGIFIRRRLSEKGLADPTKTRSASI